MLGDSAMPQTVENAIEGKVAKVLNSRELVINRGTDDGVQQGMKFEIIDDFYEILDPDSNDSLGTFKRVKIRVKAAEIYPRFSITRTYETYRVRERSAIDVASSLHFPRTVTRVRTISGSETDYEEGRSHVKVGDKVVQIPDY